MLLHYLRLIIQATKSHGAGKTGTEIELRRRSMKITNAVIGALLLISFNNVSAAVINGSIAFSTADGASWTPADNTLSTGVSITSLNADGIVFNHGNDASPTDDGKVTTAFGSYSGVAPGTFVDFNDFVFDPLTSGTPLWTFDFGGSTYSFSMLSIFIDAQTSNIIALSGTGIASIDGFEDTHGEFSLTLNNNGEAFSFSSSASAVPVPAAVWLFGSGLLGLAGIARRKNAA